jgi:NADH dehydrogenase [ubiquinone] 1 alpha subcomplex assembly factor 7
MNKKYLSLEEKIVQKIKNHGPISVDEYMEICLSDKDFGYYINSKPIGKNNDFITSPEISQMFGELIGVWLIDLWFKIGKPKINIIELGPGNGLMMQDILRVSKNFNDFYSSIKIWLYEQSNILSKIQRKNINHPFKHFSSFNELPNGINFVVANEFFDAIPIKQYQFNNNKFRERVVSLDQQNNLTFESIEINPDYQSNLDKEITSPRNGQLYEISPIQDTILEKIFSKIRFNGGLLIIDYAKTYGSSGDTLQALSKHKKVSIFHKPGESDLTSYVDFNRYSYISKKDNIKSYGPITQRDFLIGLGINQRYEILKENASDSQLDKLHRQYHRLIDKDKMGELFKVMYFSNNPKTVPISIT